MVQARLLRSAAQTQEPHSVRSRNLRTILILAGIFVAMFAGSIMYILWYPTAG